MIKNKRIFIKSHIFITNATCLLSFPNFYLYLPKKKSRVIQKEKERIHIIE